MSSQYNYKYEWFNVSEIKHRILDFINIESKNTILEIGCFEGLSSVFFADNLLNHPESKLVCVDPFLQIENNDHKDYLDNVEERFDYNISICKNPSKVIIRKETSDVFFETNTQKFNFIYIDGCHEPEFIKRDMLNAFNVLESGGIMWMDDYRGGNNDVIKNTMDTVLSTISSEAITFHTGYQIAIRKL
jgi:predicted O-methyltransferase YrrM